MDQATITIHSVTTPTPKSLAEVSARSAISNAPTPRTPSLGSMSTAGSRRVEPSLLSAAPQVQTSPKGGGAPAKLDVATMEQQVADLWKSHSSQVGEVKRTKAELQQVRANLGRELAGLKSHLVGIGKLGRWLPFLKGIRIARTTADRLVERHLATTSTADSNRPSGAIQTKVDPIADLVKALAPRIKRAITTNSEWDSFVAQMKKALSLPEGLEQGRPVCL